MRLFVARSEVLRDRRRGRTRTTRRDDLARNSNCSASLPRAIRGSQCLSLLLSKPHRPWITKQCECTRILEVTKEVSILGDVDSEEVPNANPERSGEEVRGEL